MDWSKFSDSELAAIIIVAIFFLLFIWDLINDQRVKNLKATITVLKNVLASNEIEKEVSHLDDASLDDELARDLSANPKHDS